MTAERDLTWHLATMVFGIDHSDPACPTLDAVFDAFVDATPEGLVDASHSMGPADDEPATITVPAPTPDEDGVYRPIAQAEVSTRRRVVVLDLGRPFHLRPDKAEALGAALLAAARDARLAAGNKRSET